MTRIIAAMLAAAAVCACAETTATIATRPQPAGPVFVMQPIWRSHESGNTSRDFRVIDTEVVTRILAIVRERFPAAEHAESGPPGASTVLPGYPLAVDGEVLTTEEFRAASWAREHGAAYLLVPTIREWKEMRTDDPIGALIVPHSSVALTLRLMRLRPAGLAGRAEFTNRARFTLNQPADRLLDGRFREVILRLVSGAA